MYPTVRHGVESGGREVARERHGDAAGREVRRLLQDVMRLHHRRRVAELSQVEVVEGQVDAEHGDAGDAVASKHVLCAWHRVIIIIMTFYVIIITITYLPLRRNPYKPNSGAHQYNEVNRSQSQ